MVRLLSNPDYAALYMSVAFFQPTLLAMECWRVILSDYPCCPGLTTLLSQPIGRPRPRDAFTALLLAAACLLGGMATGMTEPKIGGAKYCYKLIWTYQVKLHNLNTQNKLLSLLCCICKQLLCKL